MAASSAARITSLLLVCRVGPKVTWSNAIVAIAT